MLLKWTYIQILDYFMNTFFHSKEFLHFRKARSNMLLSRKNQLLLEFSFWNEPVPRPGPNIYELRSYQLRVSTEIWVNCSLWVPLMLIKKKLSVHSVICLALYFGLLSPLSSPFFVFLNLCNFSFLLFC